MWGAGILGLTSFYPLCPNLLQEPLLASDATLSAQLVSQEPPGLPNEKQSNKTEERKRKGKETRQTTGSAHCTIMRTRVRITPTKRLGVVVCVCDPGVEREYRRSPGSLAASQARCELPQK